MFHITTLMDIILIIWDQTGNGLVYARKVPAINIIFQWEINEDEWFRLGITKSSGVIDIYLNGQILSLTISWNITSDEDMQHSIT